MYPAFVALALAGGLVQQPDPVLWGSLVPGPYAVGYRSYWELDSTRRYGPEGVSRPVLVNIWYPAAASQAEPLRYREYLSLPSLVQNPRLGPQLEAFLLDAVSTDLFRKKEGDLNPNEHAFLNALLSKPTLAIRNAAAAEGRFPVLLYHSGAAGSYEDNSVLCEYLASHGYVLMTSAFVSPLPEYVGNNYGGPETSWGDVSFLIEHSETLRFAEPAAVGAFGHSMGAQYLLESLGQRHTPLRAVVSLDSTLEYTPEDYDGHRPLRKRLADLQPTTVPVLIVASNERHPRFSTWNRYLPNRAEAAVGHFGHGDYLLHGPLARSFNREHFTEVRASYDQLARTIRAFFDSHLKHEPGTWKRLLKQKSKQFRVRERGSPFPSTNR